jgi:hypothetical protein
MREMRSIHKNLDGNVEAKRLGNLDVDGVIILKWILKKRIIQFLDWIQVAQDNLQRQTTMNIPSYSH